MWEWGHLETETENRTSERGMCARVLCVWKAWENGVWVEVSEGMGRPEGMQHMG